MKKFLMAMLPVGFIAISAVGWKRLQLRLNLDAGLQLVDFSDDVKPVLRETAVNVILKTASRWVRLCWSALQHVCY